MSEKQIKKPVALAVGTALASTFAVANIANAETSASPFAMTSLSAGYMLGAQEGSCGGNKEAEGSCGGNKEAEGSCGGNKEAEGSCGGDKEAEGSCGGDKGTEGSCGGNKDAEGKCGEGKCGGSF